MRHRVICVVIVVISTIAGIVTVVVTVMSRVPGVGIRRSCAAHTSACHYKLIHTYVNEFKFPLFPVRNGNHFGNVPVFKFVRFFLWGK